MALRGQAIYERLEELDPTSFETDAIKLLTGLGFTQKMMGKQTKVCTLLGPDLAPAFVLRSMMDEAAAPAQRRIMSRMADGQEWG